MVKMNKNRIYRILIELVLSKPVVAARSCILLFDMYSSECLCTQSWQPTSYSGEHVDARQIHKLQFQVTTNKQQFIQHLPVDQWTGLDLLKKIRVDDYKYRHHNPE